MRESARLTPLTTESTSGLMALYQMVISQARMIGFVNVYVFLSVISIAAMPLVLLLKTRRPAGQ